MYKTILILIILSQNYILADYSFELVYDTQDFTVENRGFVFDICCDNDTCKAFTDYNGGAPRVILSTDNGDTWEIEYLSDDIKEKARSGCYRNGISIIGINYSGYYLKMRGDTSYTHHYAPLLIDRLNYIFFSDIMDTALVFADRKHLIISNNYGVSWDTIFANKENDLIYWINAIDFHNPNCIAYCIHQDSTGKNSYIISSTDQGTNWTKAKIPYVVNDIYMLDSIGYACAGIPTGELDIKSDVVYKTTDYGKNWEMIYNQVNDNGFGLKDIYFHDSMNGAAIAVDRRVLITNDGGDTWEKIKFPYPKSQTLSGTGNCRGEYLVGDINPGICILKNTSGVNEIEREITNPIIYKNDSDFLIIRNSDKDITECNIKIFDILGNMVFSADNVNISNDFNLDVANYCSGSYLVLIQDKEQIITKRFVK